MKKTAIALALVASVVVPAVASAQEVTICRGPGFYQNHAGTEKEGENIVEDILEDIDIADPVDENGVTVCGQLITGTHAFGSQESALEGLCVRTRGVEQRQLYRQLITARLNCAISEGANCKEIVNRTVAVDYNACDALCAGNPVPDGPTVEDCTRQLACFNGGGSWIDGECIKGSCNDDGVTLCGSDDDCEEGIECVRFESSCKNTQFCTDDLTTEADTCPKTLRASSPRICNTARHNSCEIDDTMCYKACADIGPCLTECAKHEDCDPAVACSNQSPCFSECFSNWTNYQCGCEGSYAYYCDLGAANEEEYIDCLYSYPVAEAEFVCYF